ncbi:uncharacterized protein [Centruroides vittatus]|uniref:uncharacterized protein isoform X1 n=2 Tax=Centruroides vittatus TaxID=120091 RepID=UPI0035107589
MVAGAFPIAKLATLAIRQISKPLSNRIKNKAKSSHFFRTYICMPPAQLYHWLEVNVKMRILNLGKPADVPKLNESMAIELGAELLGETIIFGIAALTIVAEYIRQSLKEKDKEFKQETRLQNIETNMKRLQEVVHDQNLLIVELKQLSEQQKFSLSNLINKMKKETKSKNEAALKKENSTKLNPKNVNLIDCVTEDVKKNFGLCPLDEKDENYSCLICKKYGFKTKTLHPKKEDKIEKILKMPTSRLQLALFDAVKAIRGPKKESRAISATPVAKNTVRSSSRSIIQDAILDASKLITGDGKNGSKLNKKFSYPIHYAELDLIKENNPLQNAIEDALDVLFGEVHLSVYNIPKKIDNSVKTESKYKIENYYQSNIFHDALDEAVEYIIREE